MKQTLFIASVLILVALFSAQATEVNSGTNSPITVLKPEPVRSTFSALLAADEWDSSPRSKPKPTKGETNQTRETISYKGKSRTKAIVLSALLPGSGEYYLGQKRKATYFFIAEAVNIIGFASFRTAAAWKEDDFKAYGAAHAGAAMEGKSDEFYDMMGFYANNEQYNTEGRVGDPERPYYPDNEEFHWQWQTQEELDNFKSLVDKQGQLIQSSKFMVGLAVVNRLVSIIDTAISTRHMRGGSAEEFSEAPSSHFEFAVNPYSLSEQVTLTWHTSLF